MKTRSKITLLLFALSLLAGMLFGCAAADPTTPPAEQGTQTIAPTDPASLTAQEAEQIALAHAGLTADQVTGLHTAYELDDGTPGYEIDFRHGNTEYDYTIHAKTGEILEWDKE